MAEGWARHLKSHSIQAFSAGLEAHGLNPNAVEVMQESGVDIAVGTGAGVGVATTTTTSGSPQAARKSAIAASAAVRNIRIFTNV